MISISLSVLCVLFCLSRPFKFGTLNLSIGINNPVFFYVILSLFLHGS